MSDKSKAGMAIIEHAGKSKGELAEKLYPNMAYDCAVPQAFINKLSERGFDNPAGHLITVYKHHEYDCPKAANERMMDGVVVPITDAGIYMLAILAQFP